MMASDSSDLDSVYKLDSYRAFVDDLFNNIMENYSISWLKERPQLDKTIYGVNIKRAVMRILDVKEEALILCFDRSLLDLSTDLVQFGKEAGEISFSSNVTEVSILTFLALMSFSAVYFHGLKYSNAPEILANETASILAANHRKFQNAGLWTSLRNISADFKLDLTERHHQITESILFQLNELLLLVNRWDQ